MSDLTLMRIERFLENVLVTLVSDERVPKCSIALSLLCPVACTFFSEEDWAGWSSYPCVLLRETLPDRGMSSEWREYFLCSVLFLCLAFLSAFFLFAVS